MIEWYDFPNVKSTKMLSFLFGSRGLRPDLPSPFGRKFLFCLLHWPPPPRSPGPATLAHGLHCTAGTQNTLHPRLFLAPHCTLRLPYLSVGGNTRRLEKVRPARHVGARLRGLLGPTAHGLLGRRHPGPASATWLGEVGV